MKALSTEKIYYTVSRFSSDWTSCVQSRFQLN